MKNLYDKCICIYLKTSQFHKVRRQIKNNYMKKLLQLKKTFQQVLLSMIVTLGLTVINVAAQTTITIGDPASTNYNYQIPVNNLWHYSYTQQILLASEIGMDGNRS